jgi:Fe-S-cluster formation regulator IscX/YfhJ
MVEQIATAIAVADGAKFDDDPTRFHRLVLAAIKEDWQE